jgi:undecaprenyl-diphosphatase
MADTKTLIFMIGMSVATLISMLFIDLPLKELVTAYQTNHSLKWFSKNALYAYYLLFGILLMYALIKKREFIKRVCLAYIKAELLMMYPVVRLGKMMFGRARPRYGDDFYLFTLDSDFHSFPSGHAADAFVGSCCLYYLLKHSPWSVYRHLPFLYAGAIALSRIGLNLHYPSDAIMGAAIGVFAAGFFLARIPQRRGEAMPS